MSTLQEPATLLTMAALQHARTADDSETHFKRYLRFRGTQPGEWVALEAIGPSPDNPKYKFAASLLALSSMPQCLVQLVRISDSEILPRGCFIQQNAVHPYVAARQKQDEWIKLGRDEGLKEEDIASRRAFYFDFDPKRGKNISSTDAELACALAAASAFLAVLVSILGDDLAIGLGASGNGVHIHVALDSLPNTAEVTSLIRGCLAAAATVVTEPDVVVDVSVGDARRVCPAFGTMKRKGADYGGADVPPEQVRPHRRTGFLCHDEVRRLSLEELQMLHDELAAAAGPALVATSPPVTSTAVAVTPTTSKSAWDLAKDVDIEQVSDWLGLGTGAAMVCPGCSATNGYGRVPGANVTKCHHSSCSGKGNPRKPGSRTTIDLVVEAKRVSPKDAVNLLAAQFGFAALASKAGKKKAAPAAPPPAASGAS